jgi:hypothetical protein
VRLATEHDTCIGTSRPVAAQPRSERAFDEFVVARSAVFRGALILTGNREAAEDLVQETLERARRKQATAIAGIAAALVVAGAGTALAAGVVGDGAHASHAAAAHSAASDGTTVLVRSRDGGTVTLPLTGMDSAQARAALVQRGLTPDFTRTPVAGCAQSTVVAVSPHAPTVVRARATIHVTVCTG